MKILLFSVTSISATSGGIFSLANTQNVVDSSVKFNLTNNFTSSLEISDKNISELTNIGSLKKQQKIEELKTEEMQNVSVAETRLDAYYSTLIHPIDEKSNITTFSNSNTHKQTVLQGVLSEQVKLSQKHDTYKKVKQHFTDNVPNKTNWETVTDTADATKCKIKKTSLPPTTPDSCSYDWNIITISVEDKIEQLLTNNSPPNTTQELLNQFTKIKDY